MYDNFQKLPEVVIDKASPSGILLYIGQVAGREAFFTTKQTTNQPWGQLSQGSISGGSKIFGKGVNPRDNCP